MQRVLCNSRYCDKVCRHSQLKVLAVSWLLISAGHLPDSSCMPAWLCLTTLAAHSAVKGMSSYAMHLVCANPFSFFSWVWVGECFFWYQFKYCHFMALVYIFSSVQDSFDWMANKVVNCWVVVEALWHSAEEICPRQQRLCDWRQTCSVNYRDSVQVDGECECRRVCECDCRVLWGVTRVRSWRAAVTLGWRSLSEAATTRRLTTNLHSPSLSLSTSTTRTSTTE